MYVPSKVPPFPMGGGPVSSSSSSLAGSVLVSEGCDSTGD